MVKYALIDTANCYSRARYAAVKAADSWQKVGMAMHLTLNSINQIVKKFDIDHVVFALEGRSWRKELYKPYKANRALARSRLTEEEREEDQLFWQSYDDFTKFLIERTNCSVLRHPDAEADDIIARFIDLHQDDQHTIISSDTDYYQLLGSSVSQYNGIAGHYITIDGIIDDRDRPVMDKKTGEPKTIGNPEFVLFEKIMRGDSSDNIMSAYPGVRTRGTKNKVGLMEAWEDRHRGGFSWNNLMLQRWSDPDGIEHVVREDYERNRLLIDLRAQPENIKQAIDSAIVSNLKTQPNSQVGVHFLKFCGKYELTKIGENSDQYVKWLNSIYTGNHNEKTI